ncbi:MAG: SUF system NifU family Fe-S cluster assembly protein [Bdellovibrionaceae bacterium]|nr:SUF system NifU family Fe-S cluster assembly protein [Bdellovibrionales bacterium]MCB9254958.1 SUF system NifU family Fe-S cluster assembly protein [Pseudobdellovibrionaceae bacterium]
MSELRDLYQQVIIDHSKRPRNFGPLESANKNANGHNPLCGDKISVHVLTDGDKVKDIRFEGSGCAISTASASMMTEFVKGKSIGEVEKIFKNFHALVTAESGVDEETLGKLAVFSGVCEFPMRVKCATLAWHTLHGALEGGPEAVVSTE